MSVVTDKWFEYKDLNADLSQEEKHQLGLRSENLLAKVDFMELDSRCFACGEILETPYIYWHGVDGSVIGEAKGISLHETCSRDLMKAIIRDADEITQMKQTL
jgi:hypothetical protein